MNRGFYQAFVEGFCYIGVLHIGLCKCFVGVWVIESIGPGGCQSVL